MSYSKHSDFSGLIFLAFNLCITNRHLVVRMSLFCYDISAGIVNVCLIWTCWCPPLTVGLSPAYWLSAFFLPQALRTVRESRVLSCFENWMQSYLQYKVFSFSVLVFLRLGLTVKLRMTLNSKFLLPHASECLDYRHVLLCLDRIMWSQIQHRIKSR